MVHTNKPLRPLRAGSGSGGEPIPYGVDLSEALNQAGQTICSRWDVTAVQQHQAILKPLAMAIAKNIGLILSANLISDLEETVSSPDPCAMACCLCATPRVILVRRSVLANTEITCDTCQQPFRQIGKASV